MKIQNSQKTTVEVSEGFCNSQIHHEAGDRQTTVTISDHENKQTLEINFSRSDFQGMLLRSINNLSYTRTEARKRFLQDLAEGCQKILGEYALAELEASREKEGLSK